MKVMKKIILFVVAICIVVISCEKDSESNNNEKKIVFLNTILGGCNGEDANNLKSVTEDFADTIKFTIINNDTLNVFVGLNYVCCAPFDSKTEIINDTLTMTISDTCSNSCYCRCMCYYTWDFQYIDFEKKEYNFIVKLNDPREDNTIIFKQGIVDLSK